MKYALVHGQRKSPQPRQRGRCDYCQEEVVARCGRIKAWHWAHKSSTQCDPWWETESQWHRSWKERFPTEWQEVVHTDETTGERHIADIKTDSGLVIEFQRSRIDMVEQRSREDFYRNMIWVVDGDRGSLDPDYFRMGLSRDPIQLNPLGYAVQWWGPSHLLRNWSEASAPVFLDFGDGNLWRFEGFDTNTKIGYVYPIRAEWLLDACKNGQPIPAATLDEKDVPLLRRQMKPWDSLDGSLERPGQTPADEEMAVPARGNREGEAPPCPMRSRSGL